MVFWWTGRGYLALLSTIGVFGIFGAIITLGFGDETYERLPWLTGLGVILAGIANWCLGRWINKRAINPLTVKKRELYRGRNRFLSLPMETWAIPLIAFGLFLAIRAIFGA